ncbi:hypothetical protein V8F33_009500 [Rhypophila sp. PSN 637]
MVSPVSSTESKTSVQMSFCSLGAVVLDEIISVKGKTFVDLPGGLGVLSTVGARIAVSGKGPTEARSIGMVVLDGGEFPTSPKLRSTLWDWEISPLFRLVQPRSTTSCEAETGGFLGPNLKVRETWTYIYRVTWQRVCSSPSTGC